MAPAIKTGAQHLESLRDSRTIFLDGVPVKDVTAHPAYRNAVATVAAMYDFQAADENAELMTVELPSGTHGSGRRVNRCWQLPTSYDELLQRRRALETWATLHGGFMGRSPDHVASAIGGQYMGLELFEQHGPARAKAFSDYFHYARENDLFLTYVIINPQADRSKDWGDQPGKHLTASIVDEDSAGITVRGAKMLGTSSIMANEVFVANLQPLQPGEEDLAISFAVPMNQKGLKVLSRKSFEADSVSEFDSPLAYRFDENDALMYFDDVKVPWERVFVYRDTVMCRRQFHDTPGHTMQNYQAQIRLLVKVRFLVGIAKRLAETIGTIAIPTVRDRLGQMAAQASMVEGMVCGMEAAGSEWNGYFVPSRQLMYAAQVLTQELYPNMITAIRELAGGSLIMLPSSVRDFDNPELARIIKSTQLSPVMGSEERVKFLKLAWDTVGSEFASRHVQYEMFYAGAQFVTRGHSFRTYDWEGAGALVEAVLKRYALKDFLQAGKASA
jgi:4-hydroxyphenylacetate 3-monooxygenase